MSSRAGTGYRAGASSRERAAPAGRTQKYSVTVTPAINGVFAATLTNKGDQETIVRGGISAVAALRELNGVVVRWGRGRENDRPAAMRVIAEALGEARR